MTKQAIALIALGAASCVHEPTPIERATAVARVQCSDPGELQEETRVLRETTVVKTQPITFFAGLGSRTEGGQTLMGTKLFVRPPNGVSAEEMVRVLQCHSAKALLGQADVAAVADDPFYLPDAWVDIDAKGEQGFLVVRLSADRIPQNLAVLRHATAFADAHRPVPPP
jgi:hypothetical protein